MTGGAADPFVNVNAVIEIDKAGKIMDSGPLDRFVFAKTFPDRRQHWSVGPNLAVAGHTGFRRRNTCKGAGFHRVMAIAAIDTIIPDMVFMAERDRLAASNADLGNVRRLIDGR